MNLEKTATVSFVLAVSLMGLGACRGKSDSGQSPVHKGAPTGPEGTSDKSPSSQDGRTERDLTQAELQKKIQEQTERSIQMANQQHQIMQQQLQAQRAQEQAIQNTLRVQRQVQEATSAARQARSTGQKR